MILRNGATLLVLIALSTACCTAPDLALAEPPEDSASTVARPRNPELAEELLAMAAGDQDVRGELTTFVRENPGQDPSLQLALRMLSTDAENTRRLQEIVAEHGWPTRELVGREASHAAWLLVQHADAAPAFQAAVLEEIEPLLESGEVERGEYALLTDRVLVARGERQRYGTQYEQRTEAGVVVFGPATPIEESGTLDARRATMGLGPHADYVEELRRVLAIPAEARIEGP